MRLMVASIVGGANCITTEDGRRVYDEIHPRLICGEKTELDFSGISVVASPFLNSAIGRLMKDLTPENLNRVLIITNLDPDGHHILDCVIENSRRYYLGAPLRIHEIIRETAERA